jgi:quercetin dioxygenase-like cupin family protein
MTERGRDHRLPVMRGTDDEPHRKAPREQFIGEARVHSISELLGTEQTRIRYVVFEPGARTRPHRHSKDQVLCFHGGPGVVAVDGGEDQIIREGEFVLLPGGAVHMHGATADAPTTHISMMLSIDSDFETDIPAGWARFRAPAR